MVLLSSAGWSPPPIAEHLGWSPETVRRVLKAFEAKGLDGLYRDLPGPETDIGYQRHVERTLDDLLAQARPWTSIQLSEALAECGLVLSPRQVRRYLDGMDARWRRTKNIVEHRQRPDEMRRARKRLTALKKARAGRLDLLFLDECGFSPTQPTGYSWSPHGQRRKVPYEAPQGRRVNALVAYGPYRHSNPLPFTVKPRTLTSADIVKFLFALPRGDRPCVVVLDNAGIHKSTRMHRALPRLRRRGVRRFYLPAYAPELNEIEPVFGVIKGYELAERSYFTGENLASAVRRALTRYRNRLNKK